MFSFIIVLGLAIYAVQANQMSTDNPGSIRMAHIKRLSVHSLNTTKPPVNLVTVSDPGHAAMLAYNSPNSIFQQSDADKMDQDATTFFLDYYGQNWTVGNPNVVSGPLPDQRILFENGTPLATWIPFREENDFEIKVYFDSANPKRGTSIEPNWIQLVYSVLVVYLRDGVVTSGHAKGQLFFTRYAITYGYHVYVNHGANLSKKENVEKAVIRSEEVGYGATNAWGHFVYTPTVRVYFENGDVCVYWDSQIVGFRWGANNVGAPTRTSGDHIICSY